MKRIVIAVFVGVLLGLFIWLWYNRPELSFLPSSHHTVRTIVPSVDNAVPETATRTDESGVYDESKIQPMIVLAQEESFIQAITVDINKDGVSDQICAIKKQNEPNIFLVPALQNPVTGDYSRLQEIRTGITQTRTLLFYALDIVGDRTNALVFSGMTDDNLQLLAVYLPVTEKDGKMSFSGVADLRSDGSITIQEIKRSDAYNMGLTNGDSYPIVTYSSDPQSPGTLDQIERIFRWDRTLKRYEQVSESKITGKKIETRMINQLQGGDVGSFEDFLSGLWYMPASSSTQGTKYLFFDPEANEIVFNVDTTEEVFIVDSDSPRRYGAYFSTHNRTIPSIRRLIDIELTGIDEIRIKIQEDVKLKIGVASDWDGVFRKMSNSYSALQNDSEKTISQLKTILDKGTRDWISADGQKFRTENTRYTITGPGGTESGIYTILTVKGKPVLQFKPDGTGTKSEFYLAAAEKKNVPAGEQQILSLTRVTVSINGTNLAGSPPVIFERIQ